MFCISLIASLFVSGVNMNKMDSYTTIVETSLGNDGCSESSLTFCTSYKIYTLDALEYFEVVYSGEPIICCKYGFLGKGFYVLDKYKICVETLEYDVKDCGISLGYYFGYSSEPNMTFSCLDKKPKKVCAGSNQYFDIQVDDKRRRETNSSSKNVSKSSFKLRVTAEKTYDHAGIVAPIFLTFASALLMSLVFVKVADIWRSIQKNRFDKKKAAKALEKNGQVTISMIANNQQSEISESSDQNPTGKSDENPEEKNDETPEENEIQSCERNKENSNNTI